MHFLAYITPGGAHGVMDIVLGNKYVQSLKFKFQTRLFVFHTMLIALGKVWIQLFSLSSYGLIVGQTAFFNFGLEKKLWIQSK